jgi:hypothetical protein
LCAERKTDLFHHNAIASSLIVESANRLNGADAKVFGLLLSPRTSLADLSAHYNVFVLGTMSTSYGYVCTQEELEISATDNPPLYCLNRSESIGLAVRLCL